METLQLIMASDIHTHSIPFWLTTWSFNNLHWPLTWPFRSVLTSRDKYQNPLIIKNIIIPLLSKMYTHLLEIKNQYAFMHVMEDTFKWTIPKVVDHHMHTS